MEKEEKGILVDRVVYTDSKRYQGSFHERCFLLIKLLLLIAAGYGSIDGVISCFQIEVSRISVFAAVVVISIIYTALFFFRTYRKWLLPGWFAVCAAGIVLFHKMALSGMLQLFNRIVNQINAYYDAHIPLAAQTAAASDEWFAIVIVLIVSIGIFSIGILWILDAKLVSIFFAIPLVLELSIGVFPDLLAVICMLGVLVCMMLLQHTKEQESYKHATIFVHMGDGILSALRMQGIAATAVILTILLAISGIFVGPAVQEGFDSQEELREDIRNGEFLESMRDVWKKVVRGEWDWLPFDIVRSSGVHGGRLSNVKEIKDYNELHLYLDISDNLTVPLYIRGYVGSNYTGQGWKGQTEEQKSAAKEAQMSVADLSEQYYTLLERLRSEGHDSSYGKLRFVITNWEANSAYSYIPYGTNVSAFEPSDAFDVYTEEKTDTEILDLYYMNTQKLSNLELLETEGEKNHADDSYRAYARETYLTLPEQGMERFQEEFGQLSFSSVADCVAFVRETLSEKASYTKAPGSTPRKEDYVEHFLYEKKQGVCTHFASAAVLMFRQFGIPSRYVEGYIATTLIAGNGPNAIYDSSAHAWAEIYIDGAGWVPIEVTPGFLNEEDMKDDRESSLKQDDIGETEEETSSASVETEVETETETETETQTQEMPVVEETTEPTEATKPTEPTEPTKPTEPTQPTQPSVEQEDPSSNQKLDEMFKLLFKLLLILLIIAAVIAGILLFIYGRYQKQVKRFRKALSQDERMAILEIMRRIERLSRQNGLELNEYTDVEHAINQFNWLDAETVEWYQKIALEAVYSKHAFDEDTKQDMLLFYQEFVNALLEQKHTVKRKWCKYWGEYLTI